jgi:hypothetical protein
MANQQLMIQITAQDGASGTFKAIGTGAQQMGQQVEKAGGTSTSAMSRLMATMKQASVGIGLLSASYVKFSQSAVDNERAMRTLDRTYGETADSLRAYADELQRTTTFSSEQAVEAANLFGTLSRNYGLTSDQIERLITVSADLAAVNGITLADAAERVQGAIRGEGEAAEALGLTMNDAATGLAGMSAGMTEAEKATYRYNALLGQAEYATGAAGDAAETTAGRFSQIVNSLQDAGRGFVEMTGPAGQAVAGLSSMSLELGMAVSGFAALGPVLRTAGTAFKGLAVSMGPVGLALAATAAAFALLAWADKARESEQIAEDTAESIDALGQSLEQLALSAETTPVEATLLYSINAQAELLPGTAQGIADVNEQLKNLRTTATTSDASRDMTGFVFNEDGTEKALAGYLRLFAGQEAYNAAIEDGVVYASEIASMTELATTRMAEYGASTENTQAAIDTLTAIQAGWNNEGVNTERVMGEVNVALSEFNDATNAAYGDVGLLNERLGLIYQNMTSGNLAIDLQIAKLDDLRTTMVQTWEDATAAADPLSGQITRIFSSMSSAAYQAQQDAWAAFNTLQVALEDTDPTNDAAAWALYRETIAGIENDLFIAERAVRSQNAAFAEQQALFESNGTAAAEYGAAQEKTRRGVRLANDAIAEQNRLMEQNGEAAAGVAAEGFEAYGRAVAYAGAQWGIMAAAQGETNRAALDDITTTMQDQAAAAYAAATGVGALDTSLEQLAAVGAGQSVEDIGRGIRVNILDVANDATIAINALSSGFQVLVQNPINWGKQAQDVADWATSMMLGADGVNSLSDLWGRGQIETITFNRGLEAQGRIQKANADIQNDVARIQAKQLPIMADLIEGQAEYMDKLADLDPLNQTIALGYMDTTKAAQAQNLVMLAGAAAAGEYGAMGTEMATNIITAAAQADPVLKAMLIDMGLISEGADGEIDIKFTRAKSLNDDLQRLIESIDALVVALGGIPAHTNAAVDVAFRVNGTPMLPHQIGQFGFTMATGGTVYAATRTPMYATAATGATTLVGEAGPEMVWLPGGAQVSSSPVTRDRMQRSGAGSGAGGAVNFYGPVTLAPASSDVAAAIRREALAGARGY